MPFSQPTPPSPPPATPLHALVLTSASHSLLCSPPTTTSSSRISHLSLPLKWLEKTLESLSLQLLKNEGGEGGDGLKKPFNHYVRSAEKNEGGDGGVTAKSAEKNEGGDGGDNHIGTAGLTSFPDYPVLHMRRFAMEAGWVPKKLEMYMDVPDIIDISHMRSKGQQDGEELLPDGGPDEENSKKTWANEEIVLQLASMGFNHLHCQKAAINTSNVGVEEAMNWLLSHMDDLDIDIPISEGHESEALKIVDQSKVDTLITFGFQEDVARKALKASGGDIERATDWIFSNPEASDSGMDSVASDATSISNDIGLPDGGGRYRLIGIVSHSGTSTQCGHYVAHVLKEGRWVIFNDDKVGVSINPPKEMGYLYFFERLED